jgi:ribosomal protein S18 acetylase RimI-like enzyme
MQPLKSQTAELDEVRMHPLDNVIWNALTTRQSEFAEGSCHARMFMPEVTSLGAFRQPTPEGYQSLAGLLPEGGKIGVFLDTAYQPQAEWKFITGAPLLQMVCNGGSVEAGSTISNGAELVKLDAADSPEMMELTALTKPGPFGKRTHELGTYLGIRRNGKLVAMAGERLKVPGYTEVSAVCTHPDHTGQGNARVLMLEIMQRIRDRGETAFLHVREDNLQAIRLYLRLGFHQRLRRHFAVLQRI